MDHSEEGHHFSRHQTYIVLETMSDTFLEYLQFPAVYPHIQSTATFEGIADTSDLLNWMLYEGEEKEHYDRCNLFIDALKGACNSGDENVLRGTTRDGMAAKEYTQNLVAVLDGHLLKNLSKGNVSDIAQIMTEKGLITQESSGKIIEKLKGESAEKACIAMFSLVKRGKKDWPFSFLDAVLKVQSPFQSEVPDDQRKAPFTEEGFENTPPLGSQNSTRTTSYSAGFSDGEEEKADFEDTEKELRLREYQKELAETALTGRNTIICAPTGSGKTRVSARIILQHLQSKGIESKKVAFLARTVPLVRQQFETLKKSLTSYKVGHVTGDDDLPGRNNFLLLFPRRDVVVMTPKILENYIDQGDLKLENFSLIVFDECHHTREGEPYNTLMLKYLKTKLSGKEAELPQIVGLTASIGIENAKDEKGAVENILKILGNLDCDNISMVEKNTEELRKTVPRPAEEIYCLTERTDDDPVVKEIKGNMDKIELEMEFCSFDLKHEGIQEHLKKLKGVQKKSQRYYQIVDELEKMAREVPINDIEETNMPVRSLILMSSYLKKYNVALDAYDWVQLDDVMEFLGQNLKLYGEPDYFNKYFCDLREKLSERFGEENPNLTILAQTLREHLIDKGQKSRGIVFVRTRALCYALTSWLNRCEDLKKLEGQMFTGTRLGMTQVDQATVMKEFRNGETRLLVATTVAEEGLDVPDCNLVVKYNHVGNEVNTVQSRGRSRTLGGISILLAIKNVYEQECLNKEKVKLMDAALKEIGKMSRDVIGKQNTEHQRQRIVDAQNRELTKQKAKQCFTGVGSRMVCDRCRKLTIDAKDIRIIQKMHRVVIDSSIWKSVSFFKSETPKCKPDFQNLGPVKCMLPTKTEQCDNIIGQKVIHQETPFISPKVESFVFDEGPGTESQTWTKWKLVPWAIDDMDASDIQTYRYNLRMFEESQADDSDNGFQDAKLSQEDDSKEMRKVSDCEKEEDTKVKTLESTEGRDNTYVKQIISSSQEQQLQQQLGRDSGLYSENRLRLSPQSNEATTLKVPVIVQQHPRVTQQGAMAEIDQQLLEFPAEAPTLNMQSLQRSGSRTPMQSSNSDSDSISLQISALTFQSD